MATVTTILGLTALTTVQSDDVVPVVDVHDTTQSPSGSTKKITVANLFAPYLPLSGGTLTGGLSGTTLSLSSTLGVSGASTLAALSATSGSFSTTLSVTGASTIASLSATSGTFSTTLNVTGATTLTSVNSTNLTTSAGMAAGTYLTVGTTLTVTGATTLNSTLSVTGATTLGGTLAMPSGVGITSANLVLGGGGSVVVQPTAGNNLGFFGSAGATKGTLSGVKSGNVALANLITLLASHGLLTDSTT